MSELGRLLSEARTSKDMSVADVETAIRVRQKYLEALEQGNFAALPPGTIARGFLRNYAHFLGLNPADVLQLYAQESGDNGLGPLTAHIDGARAIDYRPLEVSLLRERETHWLPWAIALLVVAALAIGGWWLLNNRTGLGFNLPDPRSLAAALGPRATSTQTATPTRPRPSVTPPQAPATAMVEAALLAPSTEASPTPTSDLLTLPIPTIQPTATRTPTPQPTATPEATAGISLTLKTTQRAWMKITVDGKVLTPELLEAGQDRGYQANQEIIVLTGNAGGVTLTVNGADQGMMGSVGQVVERTWAINGDGKVAEVVANKAPATAGPPPAATATASP